MVFRSVLRPLLRQVCSSGTTQNSARLDSQIVNVTCTLDCLSYGFDGMVLASVLIADGVSDSHCLDIRGLEEV